MNYLTSELVTPLMVLYANALVFEMLIIAHTSYSQRSPHCTQVNYVNVHYNVQAKESWEMDAPEKLEQSEINKNKGTDYFKVD